MGESPWKRLRTASAGSVKRERCEVQPRRRLGLRAPGPLWNPPREEGGFGFDLFQVIVSVSLRRRDSRTFNSRLIQPRTKRVIINQCYLPIHPLSWQDFPAGKQDGKGIDGGNDRLGSLAHSEGLSTPDRDWKAGPP